MKKLTFVMTLMLAVLLASCSKNQGGRLIPSNAFAVISIDVIKMIESTGMKSDDTSVKSQMENLIKAAGLDKDVREKLLDILDDPTSTGIDFTEPIYLYFAVGGSDGFEGGIVGTTASKGDLKDAVNMLSKMDDDIELMEYESGGVQYARIDHSTVFIFNSDWFYIGPVENGSEWESKVEDTIEDLLARADGKDNIEDNPAFEQMCDCKGLMQIGLFGTGLDGLPGTSEMLSQFPEDCELKDIAGIMDLIINNGEIVMEGEAFLMSDAWKKQAEQFNFKTIEKSQAKYADAEGALAIVNVDSKGLFDQIRKIAKNAGLSDDDLDKLDELKPVFDVLTGQGLVALNEWEENDTPEVVAYVGTRNNSLLETLLGNGTDEENIHKVGNNEYRVPIDYDYDYNDSIGDWEMIPTKYIHVGWKDNQTYFLMNTEGEPFTTPRHPFTDVKGVGIYAYVAGKRLGQAVASIDDDAERAGEAVADIVDYMEFYLESPTKSVFRIATTKKDKSPIVTIIDYVKHNFL
ncbi:MAG: DUF4836 family protein [Prevotella sp.]|nr:DUF4836 family protein [Prevotella sp.]